MDTDSKAKQKVNNKMPCGLILIRKAFYLFFDQLQSTDVRINY